MTEENVAQFKNRLSKYLNLKLDLLINNNRSTMLNLLEKKKNYARLSLHQMFLRAPDPVISAIAHYVCGTNRASSTQNLVLRGYIQQNLSRYDNSDKINTERLADQGCAYNLKVIFQKINRLYFDNQLDLQITWYGAAGRKRRSHLVFGQYNEMLKLVKIHRILDDSFFPDYFVSFIVYHEMLHAIVPGYIDERGWYRTHGEAFKRREKIYKHYEAAITWEKQNKKHFFSSRT